MYGMTDAIVQISAHIFTFFFAHRFPIPTNQTAHEMSLEPEHRPSA
jgi:hypothetical protein